MMVEAQKIFTDTTMQDQPTDFRILAGSYQRRVRLRNVAESENSWYLIQSSDIDVDVGSDVVEAKQFYRLGGTRCVDLDARIVALSSVPLVKAVDRQVFRQAEAQ